ncbi:MAG: carboxypeptidase-like regulatory domain-containing protein, partial [Silvibacterium sp.]
MRKTKLWLASLLAVLLIIAVAPSLLAQDTTGKVHGHVQDPLGIAMPNVTVQLSTDGKTAKYTFTTDANG